MNMPVRDLSSVRRGALRSLARNKTLAAGCALILLVIAVAILVPLLSSQGATTVNSADSLAGPGAAHWLGADQLGRDLLVRVSAGYRISLVVSLGSVALALVVGVPLGLIAATSSPRIGGLIMRVLDVLMAFPALLLAIVVVALMGAGPCPAPRHRRGLHPGGCQGDACRGAGDQRAELIEAARSAASNLGLVVGRLAPNGVGPVIVQASI